MYSKQGHEIRAPLSFTRSLPPMPFVGELRHGGGSYDELLGAIRTSTAEWRDVKFAILDLPSSLEPFEERMTQLKSLALPEHAFICEVTQCRGARHLQQYLEEVLSRGQGVLARQPRSLYNSTALDVKVFLFTSHGDSVSMNRW